MIGQSDYLILAFLRSFIIAINSNSVIIILNTFFAPRVSISIVLSNVLDIAFPVITKLTISCKKSDNNDIDSQVSLKG